MRTERITAVLASLLLFTTPLFHGTAFAAPATMSDALEAEAQGEVFVSPDFIWSEETPGEFQVRFTITNGSDTVIPETEVQITLPDSELRFDTGASFSGQEPASGDLTTNERNLRMELRDFQVGETYAVSASGNAGDAVSADNIGGAGNADDAVGSGNLPDGTREQPDVAQEQPDVAQEQRYSPGAMNISLVLRGYGEEHATALDYLIPDLVLETEEVPEAAESVPEIRTLMMLSASLTGTGRGVVAADVVDAPLSHALILMNKKDEYSLNNIRFHIGKEAGGSSESPFTMLWLVPFLAAGIVLLILYILYCIWDVQRRARALRFDPLFGTNEKR